MIYTVFIQYWVGFLYFLLVSLHAVITYITQEKDLFKLLSSYFKVRCICFKKNILKKLLKDDKNLIFRPAASQSTNESFSTTGEHNDTNEDTYANSSQDSTLVMREVSLHVNLWPLTEAALTAQKPTLIISAPVLLLFYWVSRGQWSWSVYTVCPQISGLIQNQLYKTNWFKQFV